MVTQAAGYFVDGIAGYLGHPSFGGMPREASERHAPGLQMQKDEHVIGREITPSQELDREEVGPGEDVHMGRDDWKQGFPQCPTGHVTRRYGTTN
jgi:hypothetical protein